MSPPIGSADIGKFKLGDLVHKTKGSQWRGRVVGFYSTGITPLGYAIESAREPGSVQIYPESAIKAWDGQPSILSLLSDYDAVCAERDGYRHQASEFGDDVQALQSQLALAREALRPFAKHLTYLENDGDYPPLREGPMEMYVDIRDLRRARAALAKLTETQ